MALRSNFPYLVTHGRVSFERTHFEQGAAFLSATFHGPVTMTKSVFDKSVDLRHAVFHDDLDLRCSLPSPLRPGTANMVVDTSSEVRLPAGWTVLPEAGSNRDGDAPAQVPHLMQ
ncbi:MAG: pentapeptide repeat-containing protein [Pseudonocardiaceae bacterium]